MKALTIGTLAPAFTLPASGDPDTRSFTSLSKFRGRPVVLAFYPADWSPVCGDQVALYNQILPEFERHGATLLGISVDGPFCHQAFANDRNLRYPLLADFEPKGRVARDYGVYREEDGTTERALFVIDADGIIRWSYVSPIDVNPGADGILRALEDLRGSTRADHSHSAYERSSTAAVSLIEYGDYECPHCRRAFPVVQRLRSHFGRRLQFEFRNFPLSEIHPHALHAAEAAVSVLSHAGPEEFEAMQRAIFSHQRDGANALDDIHLARYAAESGADAAQVTTDLLAGTFSLAVQEDFLEGVRMGVNGTPTFFIDGVRFDGDWRDLDAFIAAIEQAEASRQTAD
ncbi:MAG: redoxin domain-containing protein [Gemmatimonadaceae bacterium]|nr:redoxin domain-containing protein [Gemmatimonadaceae bacterium]